MVCLKLDIAERSILGINIQYIKDFKICINTIGMVQLQKRHTAAYIKEEIMKCLKKYGIDLNQIYSTTTDNGANVVKVGKMLQEEQEEMMITYKTTLKDDIWCIHFDRKKFGKKEVQAVVLRNATKK